MTIRVLFALLALAPASVFAAVSIQAPPTIGMGATVEITVTGSSNPRDFVTIVPKDAAAGAYRGYEYLDKPGKQKLPAPSTAGDYEVRVLAAVSPYPTLARVPLKVLPVTAAVQGPGQVAAGKDFTVAWTGPNNDRDYVGIGDANRKYFTYEYTNSANPVKLKAPDTAGEYELRYFLGVGDVVIGRQKLVVGAVSASVTGPAQVAAGATFEVSWIGPNNDRDFITLVKVGTPEKTYQGYEYTSKGPKLKLRAPDVPGDYELRYATGQTYATLARAPVKVGAVTGSVAGPAQAVAGTTVEVKWTGPANDNDFVAIVKQGAPTTDSGRYAYVASGNPVKIQLPLVPGDYEIRYALGQSYATLARAPLRITQGAQEPGFIAVAAVAAKPTDRSVEVILDASGSMLQKLGGQRRIEIARRTLTKLVTSTLPATTPFALRVFGREADSCGTDLLMPLAPLAPAAASKAVAALDAKNGARTAIGASLEQSGADLRAATGERVVVVITDGEETCAGNPPAAIRKLVQAAPRTVVHFVGFAVDDPKVAAAFQQWAALGNGSYFDARDGAALDTALTNAMQPGFDVVDGTGKSVARGRAGDEPVRVMPGAYSVRVGAATRNVVVKPKETVAVKL